MQLINTGDVVKVFTRKQMWHYYRADNSFIKTLFKFARLSCFPYGEECCVINVRKDKAVVIYSEECIELFDNIPSECMELVEIFIDKIKVIK